MRRVAKAIEVLLWLLQGLACLSFGLVFFVLTKIRVCVSIHFGVALPKNSAGVLFPPLDRFPRKKRGKV